MRALTTLRVAGSRCRADTAVTVVLLLLLSGCGILSQPLGVEEAREHYAGLSGAIREALDEEFDDIPPKIEGPVPYSGSIEDCSWNPGSTTVLDDFDPSLRDDVAEVVQPVLSEHGFEELHEADHPGVQPYLIATDSHGAEVTVSRLGDAIVGIEIPVDTGGRECEAAALG